ncbi:MAG: permease [Spirochaetaceae bacterium]
MNAATVTVNALALAALVWAVIKDRQRTKQALRIALRSFIGMLPMVLTIIIVAKRSGLSLCARDRRCDGGAPMNAGVQGRNGGSGNRKASSKQLVTMRSLATLVVVAAGAAVLFWLLPDNREQVFGTSWRFLLEMISILPAIVVLIGLFAVFTPKQMVADYIGHASGLKGFLLAALLGSLPTGPLYVAFPLAAAMLSKGVRVATIIAFLTGWACIKLPQEMVELQFMGLEFTLVRLTLTLIAAVVMGLITERIMSIAPAGGRPAD